MQKRALIRDRILRVSTSTATEDPRQYIGGGEKLLWGLPDRII